MYERVASIILNKYKCGGFELLCSVGITRNNKNEV